MKIEEPKIRHVRREDFHEFEDQLKQLALQLMRQTVPVRSGRLRDSIRIVDEGNQTRVGTNLPYAAYVEDKTHFARIAFERLPLEVIT